MADPLSPLEASILASFAEAPEEYVVDDMARILPEASPAAKDIARVLLASPEELPALVEKYSPDIVRTASALRTWVDKAKDTYAARTASAGSAREIASSYKI